MLWDIVACCLLGACVVCGGHRGWLEMALFGVGVGLGLCSAVACCAGWREIGVPHDGVGWYWLPMLVSYVVLFIASTYGLEKAGGWLTCGRCRQTGLVHGLLGGGLGAVVGGGMVLWMGIVVTNVPVLSRPGASVVAGLGQYVVTAVHGAMGGM